MENPINIQLVSGVVDASDDEPEIEEIFFDDPELLELAGKLAKLLV